MPEIPSGVVYGAVLLSNEIFGLHPNNDRKLIPRSRTREATRTHNCRYLPPEEIMANYLKAQVLVSLTQNAIADMIYARERSFQRVALEAEVLERRLGLRGEKPFQELETLAKNYNRSGEWARARVYKAFCRLSHPYYSKTLKVFFVENAVSY